MCNLDRAIVIACKAHSGQVDKSGQPYILHPLRLMFRLQTKNEKITGILHDVVEDGDVSFDDLREQNFSDIIINAVDSLTKRWEEYYDDFIIRLSANKLAKAVKIEDIKDNLDISRLRILGADDLTRIEKYHRALIFLLDGNQK